jgi:hypothetical protein
LRFGNKPGPFIGSGDIAAFNQAGAGVAHSKTPSGTGRRALQTGAWICRS